MAAWEDYDDLLFGPESGAPARIRYERNAALLKWVSDWLGVNRRDESRRALRGLPSVSVPARYRRVPANKTTCFRGIRLTQAAMDELLTKGHVTLRKNGLVSFSLDYGRAAEFAILGPSVVVEKPLRRKDVFIYVPATLDDMAWEEAKTEDEWHHARQEMNFFAREEELLIRDDDPYWRRIDLLDCVRVDDGRSAHPFSGKSIARRRGLIEGRAASILVEMQKLFENRLEFLKTNLLPRLKDAIIKDPGRFGSTPQIVAEITDEDWPEHIEGFWERVLAADPDQRGHSNTQWLLTVLIKGGLRYEDLVRAKEALTQFMRIKRKLAPEQRDLNRFKTLQQLEQVVDDNIDTSAVTDPWHDPELDREMSKQAEVLLNTPEYKIVVPLTRAASCYFGGQTKWCTARDDEDNQFDYYTQDAAKLYIILDKRTGRRWQFSLEHQQFMDERDSSIDLTEFIEAHPQIAQFFTKLPPKPADLKVGEFRIYGIGQYKSAIRVETGQGLDTQTVMSIIAEAGAMQDIHIERVESRIQLGRENILRIIETLREHDQVGLHGDAKTLNATYDIYYNWDTAQYGHLREVGEKIVSTEHGAWFASNFTRGAGMRMRTSTDYRLYAIGGSTVTLVFGTRVGDTMSFRSVTPRYENDEGIVDLLIADPALQVPFTRFGRASFDISLLELSQNSLHRLFKARRDLLTTNTGDGIIDRLKIAMTPAVADIVSEKLGVEIQRSNLVLDVFNDPAEFIRRFVRNGENSRAMMLLNYLNESEKDIDAEVPEELAPSSSGHHEIVKFLDFIEKNASSLHYELEKLFEKRIEDRQSFGRIFNPNEALAREISNNDDLSEAFDKAMHKAKVRSVSQHASSDFYHWLERPRMAGVRDPEIATMFRGHWYADDPFNKESTHHLRLELRIDRAIRAIHADEWPSSLEFVDFRPEFDFDGDIEAYLDPIWSAIDLVKWDIENDEDEEEEDENAEGGWR